MKNVVIALILIGFCWVACGPGKNSDEATDSTEVVLVPDKGTMAVNNISATSKEKILGAWTGGEYDNATFDIRQDSMYNVEHLESYKYTLNKDSIKIYYPDFVYSAKIYFIKDTLVMSSEDGEAKYWKFKD